MAASPTTLPISFPSPPTERTLDIPRRRRRAQARSILKKTNVAPRQAFTIGLLLLSLIILTLSVIYSSCVVLPHSNYSKHSPPDTLSTIQSRDDPTGYVAESGNNTSQQLSDAAQVDQQQHEYFTTSTAMAILGFYALTLPFLTMLHAGIELLVLCARPETLNAASSRQSRYKRILSVLSSCASVALLLGWIPMNLIWMNCEITGFSPVAEEKLCPVQLQGHHMGGVDELSIAKVVFGWMTVLTYVCYIFYVQFLSKRDIRSRNEGRRRARFASTKGDVDDEPEDVVIGLEENVVKDINH